ncbi:MAG: TolC family protein [Spirochaetota bacterium]
MNGLFEAAVLKRWAVLSLCFFFLFHSALPGAVGEDKPASLTIEEAYTLLKTNSETLHVKALELQKSREMHKEVRSKALPRLTLESSASYLINPPEGMIMKKGEFGRITIPQAGSLSLPEKDVEIMPDAEHTYFKLSAVLSQPVFTWGKIRNAINLARLQVEISGLELEKQEADLKREAHRAYYGAVLARESGVELQKLKEILLDILSDREKNFKAGTLNRQSVLEAREKVAELETQLIEAEESQRTSLESLGILTGVDPENVELTSSFRQELPLMDEELLKEQVIKSAKEVEIFRKRVIQAQKKLKIAQGSSMLLPDLFLSLAFDVKGQRIPLAGANWTDTWDWDLIISVGTKVDLFDSGESFFKIKEAEKELQMASFSLSEYEKVLKLQVRQNIQAMKKAYYETLEKSARIERNREQLKNAEVSFENELITREEYLGSQAASISTNLEYLFSLYTFEEALSDLEYLLDRSFK